jgi:hypothetical protein
MKSHVNVCLVRGTVTMSSYSKTIAGPLVMNGYFETGVDYSDDYEVGAAVLRASQRSEMDVPMPDFRTESPLLPMLTELGFKSYNQYAKSRLSVHVEISEDSAVATPYRNDGPQKGFVPQPELSETVTVLTEREVGAATRRALSRAT